MENTHEFSEINQIRTRCTIQEAQIEVLQKQNAELKATITMLYPDKTSSKDENMRKWKDVKNVGKFPLSEDDGSFQV